MTRQHPTPDDAPATDCERPATARDTEVPRTTHLSYLLSNPVERDFATLVLRVVNDETFRDNFWKDPAGTIACAGMRIDSRAVDALYKSDQKVFDKMLDKIDGVMRRGAALDFGEQSKAAIIPLLLGVAIGMLAMEVAHHHFSLARDFSALDAATDDGEATK